MEDHIGSAVISNTHIIEVDILLNGSKLGKDNSHLTELRILDLFTLIDAIILNDHLYSLPAYIDNEHNDFWNFLSSKGILKILDTSNYNIGAAIVSSIEKVTNLNGVVLERFPDLMKQSDERIKDVVGTFDDWLSKLLRDFYLIEARKPPFYGNLNEAKYKHTVIDSRRSVFETYEESILDTNSFKDMSQQLAHELLFGHSGRYERCTSVLRDLYYIISAESFRMPYYPQSNRVEFANKFPNYFDSAFKTKLYNQLAKGLHTTISEVYEDFQEATIFIPPFAAIILSRSNNLNDILRYMLELREEFSRTRQTFNKLELERRSTEKLKDRKKIRSQQKFLLEEAGKAFGNDSKIKLAPTIKYLSDITKPILSPQDPSQYGESLLLQPLEAIINWWRKRPLTKIYSLKDKVDEVKNYDKLIQKFFPPVDTEKLKRITKR